MDIVATVIGYMASLCMVLGYLPQAWHTIRTRDTEGIAYTTFLLMGLGSVFFVIQGFLIGNPPLWITNIITTAASAVIFGIKVYNDIHSRRKSK